jgi:hypothetical protein
MLKAYDTCDTRALDIEIEEKRLPTSEQHLFEIMGQPDSGNMTNTFKTQRNILEASFKEKDLDIHFVLSLCIKKSRESFMAQFRRYVT